MGCPNTGPFEGGVWIDPTIVDGKATGITLDSAKFTQSVLFDESAAAAIYATIRDKVLADIAEQMANSVLSDTTAIVNETTGTEIPDIIIGSREQLLGKPVKYFRRGNYLIPAYSG